jgi:hypothetical protein
MTPPDAREPGKTSGLDVLYSSVLQPRLAALERERLKLKEIIVRGGILAGGPLVLFLLSMWGLFDRVPGIGGFGAALVCFALLLVCAVIAISKYVIPALTAYRDYRARYKRDVVAEVFRLVCPGADYTPERHVSQEVFDQSGIFARRGDLTGDDLVRGRIGQTPFEASELKRSYAEGSGSNRREHVVFHGLFFHFDFNRALHGRTVVQSKSAHSWQVGPRDGLERVPVEHTAFAGRFEVFSSDPAEARSILTPALMERVVAIDGSTGHPVSLAFAGNRAFAAVHYGKALFEAGIRDTTSFAAIEEIAGHFGMAELLVQSLDLNTRDRTKAVDESLLQAPSGSAPIELADALAKATAHEEDDTGPMPRKPDTKVQVFEEAGSVTVKYPTSPWLVPMMLLTGVGLFIIVTAVLSVYDLGVHHAWWIAVTRLIPQALDLLVLVAEHPVAWGLGAAVVAGLPTLWWLTVTRRVRIERNTVFVSRGVRPFPRRYPRPEYDRIIRMGKAVYLKRSAGSSINHPSVSPMLGSEEEARWVASVMRRALRR